MFFIVGKERRSRDAKAKNEGGVEMGGQRMRNMENDRESVMTEEEDLKAGVAEAEGNGMGGWWGWMMGRGK